MYGDGCGQYRAPWVLREERGGGGRGVGSAGGAHVPGLPVRFAYKEGVMRMYA